jgi:FdhD protein
VSDWVPDTVSDTTRQFEVVQVRGGNRRTQPDRAATEEPLEIRLHGRSFAVIMRTPGHDRELSAGFLLSERVISTSDDIGAIAHCADADAENIVNVTLTDESILDRTLADRRQVTTNSSCGLCGRRTIESLIVTLPPLAPRWSIDPSILIALPNRLRSAQAAFDMTGGLHAAALFTSDGSIVEVAEDVGRHNAVDKVIGRMLLREALPLSTHILCVSGRTSYEIVQKAVIAGIPLVAAVSAPSSLAIDLAAASGLTLVGFVRGNSFNIYTHPERIAAT